MQENVARNGWHAKKVARHTSIQAFCFAHTLNTQSSIAPDVQEREVCSGAYPPPALCHEINAHQIGWHRDWGCWMLDK
jgi:hypothetical protein